MESFGDKADVLTIKHEEVAIASVMSFYFRDEVLPYYGGGTDAGAPGTRVMTTCTGSS